MPLLVEGMTGTGVRDGPRTGSVVCPPIDLGTKKLGLGEIILLRQSGTVVPLLANVCFCALASLPRRRSQCSTRKSSEDHEVRGALTTTSHVANVTHGHEFWITKCYPK